MEVNKQVLPTGGSGSMTINATQVVTSDPVDVTNAREVAFYAKATNANALSAAVYEWSWDYGVTWFAENASYFDKPASTIISVDMSTAPAIQTVGARQAAGSVIAHFVATHMRLKVTGHATLAITGFQMWARAFPVG